MLFVSLFLCDEGRPKLSTERGCRVFDEVIPDPGTDSDPVLNVRNRIVQRIQASVAIKPISEKSVVLAKSMDGFRVLDVPVFAVSAIEAKPNLVLAPLFLCENVSGGDECLA